MLLIALLLLSGYAFSQQDKTPGSQGRVMVRIDMVTADEEPYIGQIVLISTRGDTVILTTNQYGLGWGYLEPGSEYTVSAGEFWHYTRFKTSTRLGQEQSLELRLPERELAGRMAASGKGLLLVNFTRSNGDPVGVEEVWAISTSSKKRYGTMTDGHGVARIEVPANDKYTLYARGIGAFETHRFPPLPAGKVQTVEVDLVWDGGRNAARVSRDRTGRLEANLEGNAGGVERTTPKAQFLPEGVSPQRERQSPRMASAKLKHQDSVDLAGLRLKRSRTSISRASFVMPQRPTTPSPVVRKRIIDGVHMLRSQFIQADRVDPRFRHEMQLEVLRPLLRNDFDSMVFVIDVTCSMDAFIEEYLLWFVLARHAEKVHGCVLFNDGDGREGDDKPLGRTGGVRYCAADLPTIADSLLVSLSFGCSGDVPENDLEALLVAQMVYPEAKGIILIADNASAVRDLALLPNLTMPVHVFLCGQTTSTGELPPHDDYVTIAYHTGGSVHTLAQDLSLKKEHTDPGTLRFRGYEYRYLEGRYRLVDRKE